MKYLFIILDRYEASESVVATFNSKMNPLQAFRFAWEGNVDEELEDFEEEVYPKLKVKDKLVTFDSEEQSYILVSLS
jgi:hypothetical protein